MTWERSTGHNRTRAAAWVRLRKQILERDQGICYVCRLPGATFVDHIVPVSQGGTDDPTNLGAIHDDPCHRRKTAREANAARPRERRPVERHPGLLA